MNADAPKSDPRDVDRHRLGVFMATSGHSGVDRIMKNLVPAFAERGVRVDVLQVRRHGPRLSGSHARVRSVDLKSAHTYGCFPTLIRYLRRCKPQALLSDKDRVNRVALLAAKLSGVNTRVVVRTGTTVSENIAHRGLLERRLQYLSMHYLYRLAAAVVVPSQGAAENLAAFARLPIGHVRVLPNPVVTPAVRRQSHEPVDHPWLTDKSQPVILGVGELSERKDFETLIRAFQRVCRQRPCRLIILGKGRLKESLESLVTALQLADRVDLAGFVNNPYAFMARADLFVLSSLWEGFGNVLVEALAVGTPVVSTDCPSGPREVLQNDRFGRLVPVRDPAAMADAILQTLQRPPEAEFLRQASRPFQLETSVDRYLEVLGLVN